jgi:KaiC/GvpD/RAD55 family RecA-like ATPase
MAWKYECPRCGSAIKPGDEQCDRCGEEMVRQDVKMVDRSKVKPFTVDRIGCDKKPMEMDFNSVRQEERKESQPSANDVKEQPSPNGLALESKFKVLEQELKAYRQQMDQMEAKLLKSGVVSPPPTPLPTKELLAEITTELNVQLGKGCECGDGIKILPTHIEKLDHMLGGGIPSGHLVLVTGAPGTMKTTLTFTILFNAAKQDKMHCLYLSLEQNRGAIIKQMERMDMRMAETEDRLMMIDMVGLRKAMVNEPGDWRSILLRYVQNINSENRLNMLVLDSLEAFRSLTSGVLTRRDMKDLFDWFKELNITVFLIAENWTIETQEAYLADGVIELNMKELDDLKVQRWVRVPKMRTLNVDTRYHAIFHDGRRFVLTLPIVQMDRGVHS